MSSTHLVRAMTPADLAAVTALHDRVFGPGCYARTAYRVREGAPPISPYCLVSKDGKNLIAGLRFTEISIGGEPGALLLGPLAVEPAYAGQGFGKQLVATGLARAREGGVALVLLVGDEPYYGRFGFRVVPPGQIELPGPVNPARLLAAELTPGALARYRGRVAA